MKCPRCIKKMIEIKGRYDINGLKFSYYHCCNNCRQNHSGGWAFIKVNRDWYVYNSQNWKLFGELFKEKVIFT